MIRKPFIKIDAKNFSLGAFEIKPLEGYEKSINKETKKELPFCCEFHEGVHQNITEHYKKFPNCCKWHKPLGRVDWFKKKDYEYVVDKVINQLSYTEHCIKECINDIDWYNAITEYIDFNISSFGQLRGGFGSPVGLSVYTSQLKHYILNTDVDIPQNKRGLLVDFFEIKEQKETDKTKTTDLNVLYATYQKWLKIFPFDISFFSHLKESFEKQIPILNGKPQVNRYSRVAKAKMHTKDSLVETLLKVTDSLITQINSLSLYEKGLLTEPQKIKLEIVINERKLKIKKGYINKSQNEEQRYRSVLKEWFKDEKKFIDEIIPLLKDVPAQELNTKTANLKTGLDKYKLSVYLNGKGYKVNDIMQLIQKHSGRELMPYTIALLSEIKYLDYFFDEFTKNKTEGIKLLSKIFESTERRIKGNVNILNEGSKEDAAQYTSHTFIEKIRKSIKGL